MFLVPLSAQITTPVIRANFGVDGDMRANSYNGQLQPSDDWFSNGTSGTGQAVIDTTGAAAIRAGYASDVSPFRKRMASFYRTMSKPAFSVVNNRLWLDALFVRDYHGNDTTVFVAGSDKNGMSPESWSGGVQSVPDKNDILDMYMHVRRSGPTSTDSLWMFGGLALDNVTGNRYFDFEMYQTDIYYDRTSARWYGYGPDAGHTSWKFDAAGNVLAPGDIIFSAEYQSASLTSIEARIWVHKDALNTTPAAFSWSGKFDGSGSGATYGYASILPKSNGAFYTGLQCGNSEWAGPFNLVLQDNSIATNFSARQFMEFSVNLTKLGLDPVTVFGTDVCGTPFNRMVVKTRASASFTAELKDFVAPTDLFLAQRVMAAAEVPEICGSGSASRLSVINPVATSVYTWSTPNGSIIGSTVGPEVYGELDGMYIVTQKLMAGCSNYAQDTVYITHDTKCSTLAVQNIEIKAALLAHRPKLQWTCTENRAAKNYEVQRSTDGVNFTTVHYQPNSRRGTTAATYHFTDSTVAAQGQMLYYRIRVNLESGAIYSAVARVQLPLQESLHIYPNPVQQDAQLYLSVANKGTALVKVLNIAGVEMWKQTVPVAPGQNRIVIAGAGKWLAGSYVVVAETATGRMVHKLSVSASTY
jgi:hypothetical protein